MVPTPIELVKTKDYRRKSSSENEANEEVFHYRGKIENESEFTIELAQECVRLLNTFTDTHSIIIEIKSTKHIFIINRGEANPGLGVWLMRLPDAKLNEYSAKNYRADKKKQFEVMVGAFDLSEYITDPETVWRLINYIHSPQRLELSQLINIVKIYNPDLTGLTEEQLKNRNTLKNELLKYKQQIVDNPQELFLFLSKTLTFERWQHLKQFVNFFFNKSSKETCKECSHCVREAVKPRRAQLGEQADLPIEVSPTSLILTATQPESSVVYSN